MSTQPTNLETAETAQHKPGKSRVKPRHLSPIVRQAIVDYFAACGSVEDTPEAMRLPSRCVDDVIKWALVRKGPQPERRTALPYLVGRQAA